MSRKSWLKMVPTENCDILMTFPGTVSSNLSSLSVLRWMPHCGETSAPTLNVFGGQPATQDLKRSLGTIRSHPFTVPVSTDQPCQQCFVRKLQWLVWKWELEAFYQTNFAVRFRWITFIPTISVLNISCCVHILENIWRVTPPTLHSEVCLQVLGITMWKRIIKPFVVSDRKLHVIS